MRESYVTVAVKNWTRFQHFKNRRPPWIKLYRDLLDDPEWHDLSGDDAKALVMIWLIASEDAERLGRLPDSRRLAFRLRITQERADQLTNRLSRWLANCDEPISSRYQDDAPETERETELEAETDSKETNSKETENQETENQATENQEIDNQETESKSKLFQSYLEEHRRRIRNGI